MRVRSLAVIFLLVAFCAMSTAAQTTEFVYQGALQGAGLPANGSYDFEFLLFDDLAGNSQVGPTLTLSAVAISNGVFNVKLDFGSVFPGAARFLEIHVRQAGSGAFTHLVPRQKISNAPYAVKSLNADNATTAVTAQNAITLAGVPASGYLPTTGGTISGDLAVSGVLSGNGSGLTNVSGTFKWYEVTGSSQQAMANSGYVANSSSQVTITLPKSLSVGDTVRVTSPGSGGWKIAQNEGQRVIGGTLFYRNWTGPNTWTAAASSSDGTKLVIAVGGGQIYTSTDSGLNWTPREMNRQWSADASSSDGTKLVAVVNPGMIYTSTDSGVSWTPRESSRAWQSVASSSDGVKLVAVENGGRIYTSTDSGASWTPRDSARTWTAVASSADGTKLVAAVGGSPSGMLYTSTDSGVSWTPHSVSAWWTSVASSSDGTKLVATSAVGGGSPLYTSTDSGVTWTPRISGFFVSVASSSDGTHLVTGGLPGAQFIYTSTDSGVTWTARNPAGSWVAFASSSDGTKLIALQNSSGTGKIYTSIDAGVSWTSAAAGTLPGSDGYLTGVQYTAVELQYIGNGLLIPISSVGQINAF